MDLARPAGYGSGKGVFLTVPPIKRVLRHLSLASGGATMIVLAGCASPQNDDRHRIAAAVLAQLTSNGRPICVDSRTRGEPLSVFRTMIVAPNPARRPLAWRAPSVLLAPRVVRGPAPDPRRVTDTRTQLAIAEATEATLPAVEQVRLNGLAREAMVMKSGGEIDLAATLQAPRARVRWAPINRFDPNCDEPHSLTRPVINRSTAFVTVVAAHQGTTYAVERRGNGWVPTAQWSTWLY